MDIVAGLSALSHALGIAKELREIDKGVDEAGFKLRIAELQTSLADAKIALSDAKVAISDRDAIIHDLRERLEALSSGEICPVCRKGKLETKVVRKHPTFGDMGVQEHDLECSNEACQHTESRMVDPHDQLGA
jgi:DNA repair exonuclease SbcCD ATPase subunit